MQIVDKETERLIKRIESAARTAERPRLSLEECRRRYYDFTLPDRKQQVGIED
jgi:hypothetical protein